MATVTLASGGTRHPSVLSNRISLPYKVEKFVDFAEAATEKGSALEAADVIQALDVPAGTWVLGAGLEVVSVATGESADVTVDLGYGGDVDLWVDGFDLDGAAAGAYAALVGDGAAGAGAGPVLQITSADTIDLLIATATTAPTGGVVRVFAVLLDVSNSPVGPATIAQVGS